MKKFLDKKIVFSSLIGIIICFTVTVSATILYNSNEVNYTPIDSSWNVNTVKEAIDDLRNINLESIEEPVKILNYGYVNRTSDGRCNYATSNVIITTIPKDGKYTLIVSESGYVYHGVKYYIDSTSFSLSPGRNHLILDLQEGQKIRVEAIAGISGGDPTVSNCYSNTYGILLQGEVENNLITS